MLTALSRSAFSMTLTLTILVDLAAGTQPTGVSYFSLDPANWTTDYDWSNKVSVTSNGRLLEIRTVEADSYLTNGISNCADYKDIENSELRIKWRVNAEPGHNAQMSAGMVARTSQTIAAEYVEPFPFDDDGAADVPVNTWLYTTCRINTNRREVEVLTSTTGYGGDDVDSFGPAWGYYVPLSATDKGAPGVVIRESGKGSCIQIAEAKVMPLAWTPKLYALAIGMDYGEGGVIAGGPNGKRAAEELYAAVSQFGNFASDNLPPLILTPDEEGNVSKIRSAIMQIENRIRPGDQFLLTFVGHGGYDSELTPGQRPEHTVTPYPVFPWTDDNVGDEYLMMGSDEETLNMSDDELRALFDSPKWDGVNKMFVLDSCFAGGFWTGGDAPDGDLNLLPRTALLAAAPEDTYACYDTLTGAPYFTGCVTEGLEYLTGNGATTLAGLADYIETFDTAGAETQIWATLTPTSGNTTIDFQWNPVMAATADYEGQVPEPGAVLLLCMGAAAVLLRRW